MEKYILNFLIMALLASCLNKSNEKETVSFTSDELDIINKIIKTINQENKIVIINKNIEITYTTQDNNNRNNIYKYLKRTEDIGNDLLNSFKRNNNKHMRVEKDIIFGFNFIWWNGLYWTNDPIKYYGIATFSKTGFNKEQTKAIIYIGITINGTGEGNYYILEKTKGEWEIVNTIGGWIT
jgi:hypothetical protein